MSGGGMVVAAARATRRAGTGSPTPVRLGPWEVLADDRADDRPPAGPSPIELLTGALASCSASSVRAVLEESGYDVDLAVAVEYDAMPPVGMQRTVVLPEHVARRLDGVLLAALEITRVTLLLRETVRIRTVIRREPDRVP